jgi:hypothetical protein
MEVMFNKNYMLGWLDWKNPVNRGQDCEIIVLRAGLKTNVKEGHFICKKTCDWRARGLGKAYNWG